MTTAEMKDEKHTVYNLLGVEQWLVLAPIVGGGEFEPSCYGTHE
jgi:hypothetical protein